jgi:hypothetical protein
MYSSSAKVRSEAELAMGMELNEFKAGLGLHQAQISYVVQSACSSSLFRFTVTIQAPTLLPLLELVVYLLLLLLSIARLLLRLLYYLFVLEVLRN